MAQRGARDEVGESWGKEEGRGEVPSALRVRAAALAERRARAAAWRAHAHGTCPANSADGRARMAMEAMGARGLWALSAPGPQPHTERERDRASKVFGAR